MHRFFRGVLALLAINTVLALHESGHWIAARWAGVTIHSFSVGVGPRLLHRTIGATDYALCAVPIGAYVGLASGPSDSAAVRRLDDVSPWVQAGIFAAGPVINLIVGALVIFLLDPYLDSLPEPDTPERRHGFGRVVRQARGFVTILRQLSGSMGGGWRRSLVATAVLSVDLGLTNLVPLPPLDGGRMAWLVVRRFLPHAPHTPDWLVIVAFLGLVFVVLWGLIADILHWRDARRVDRP